MKFIIKFFSAPLLTSKIRTSRSPYLQKSYFLKSVPPESRTFGNALRWKSVHPEIHTSGNPHLQKSVLWGNSGFRSGGRGSIFRTNVFCTGSTYLEKDHSLGGVVFCYNDLACTTVNIRSTPNNPTIEYSILCFVCIILFQHLFHVQLRTWGWCRCVTRCTNKPGECNMGSGALRSVRGANWCS